MIIKSILNKLNRYAFTNFIDIGGAEGLAQAHDKHQLRIKRCFEIVLVSDRVIRFEV